MGVLIYLAVCISGLVLIYYQLKPSPNHKYKKGDAVVTPYGKAIVKQYNYNITRIAPKGYTVNSYMEYTVQLLNGQFLLLKESELAYETKEKSNPKGCPTSLIENEC